MKIALLGPPASGKGTMAEMLSQEYNIPWISAGDVLRRESRKDTELGKWLREELKTGRLIPPDIVNELVNQELSNLDSWIIDGYPRDMDQARYMDEHNKPHLVVLINIPREVSEIRILYRRQCPKCGATYNLKTKPPKKDNICDYCGSRLIQRNDDKPEVLEKRWSEYINKTLKVINHYKMQGLVVEINGDQSIMDEYKEFKEKLKAKGLLKE